MSRPLTRADLNALPSYVPGRNPADLARELGLSEAIKLASNEVPFGPLPGVTDAIAGVLGEHVRPGVTVVLVGTPEGRSGVGGTLV